jgi:hypothetical protein
MQPKSHDSTSGFGDKASLDPVDNWGAWQVGAQGGMRQPKARPQRPRFVCASLGQPDLTSTNNKKTDAQRRFFWMSCWARPSQALQSTVHSRSLLSPSSKSRSSSSSSTQLSGLCNSSFTSSLLKYSGSNSSVSHSIVSLYKGSLGFLSTSNTF